MLSTTQDNRPEFEKVIEFLKSDIAKLRTGRANPSLVESIHVEAYGTSQALVGLASISAPDARTIMVEPWDKSIVKDIEKAILEAKIGLNPVVAGQVIRIPMPELTEETRKDIIKILHEKLENARVSVRNIREDVRSGIVQAEKDKEISEDEKYQELETLDKVSAEFNEKIKSIGEDKEKEIMTL